MKSLNVHLSFREGGSDKIYDASLEPKGRGFVVNFAYGRRGSSLNVGSKTPNALPYDEALEIFQKLVRSKQAKGYTEDPSGKVFKGAVSEARDTGVRPQLLNFLDEADLEKYITDDNWCAQEKQDGVRRLLFTEATDYMIGAGGANRKGLSLPLENDLKKELQSLPDGMIIDGEALGFSVMVFDLISENIREEPYLDRYKALQSSLRLSNELKRIHLVETAWNTKSKRSLLKRLKDENAEGIVFKDIRVPYSAGRPASGGTQLKFKFCATASCIVTKANQSKRSISLGVYNGNKMIEVGNCTVYPNMEVPGPTDIVEVKYLYFRAGGSLYQPVLLGVRTDIDLLDCTLSQLKLKQESDDEQ